MTRNDDIERVLEVWLAEGPRQMSDRLFDGTLERIDRLPQPRLARLRTRLPIMNLNLRLAALAAAVVIAVGVGVVFPRLLNSVMAVPTQGVTVPTEAPTPLVDPAMLLARWNSVGERTYPKFPADEAATLIFDATTLSMNGWKGSIDSSWSLTGPDHHLFVTMTATQENLTRQHFACLPGQEGRYTVGLSADGGTMTLTPVTEACSSRADIFTGDWTRSPCPNPHGVCGPELAPGLHRDSFAPTGEYIPASPPPVLSGYSYVVPAGWSSMTQALGRRNDPAAMAVTLTLDVVAHSQDPNCPDAVERGVGTSAADLATWVHGLPGLVTTTPAPITIGGHSGFMMDASVTPTWRLACEESYPGAPLEFNPGAPARVVFTFTDPAGSPNNVHTRTVLVGDAHSRYILLEFGATRTLLIEISAPDEASWNDLVQAAMPIVETFEFTP